MKKSLVALAALAATAAFAQSTAVISGSINVGIMDTGKAGGVPAVSTLGGGANAINIVTVEDLGGGLRGGFDSQMRFNSATGDRASAGTGAALFHGANVYLGGSFGTVRMGKIIEASNCAYDPWACTGGAGLSAGSTTGGLIAAQTIANAVSYATPTIAGFSGTYQTSVSTRTNERSVLSLNYANGPLAASFSSLKQDFKDVGTGTTDQTVNTLGANYAFGDAKLFGLYQTNKTNTNSVNNKVYSISGTYTMGAVVLMAQAGELKNKVANTKSKLWGIGADYNLSKRTAVYATYARISNDGAATYSVPGGVGAAAAGGSSRGFEVGMRHSF